MTAKDQRVGDRHAGHPHRTLRGIDPALWQAAKDKAAKERREKGVSEVVIELLAEWVKQ